LVTTPCRCVIINLDNDVFAFVRQYIQSIYDITSNINNIAIG